MSVMLVSTGLAIERSWGLVLAGRKEETLCGSARKYLHFAVLGG